jgi:hypothetical protein
MKTFFLLGIAILLFAGFNSKAKANYYPLNLSGNFDYDKLISDVYDIYKSDEVHVKKERMVYKKLNELINQSFTFKITCSDSISFDKKTNQTVIKSKEVYYRDNTNGYFGIFVIVRQSGDDLLMSSAPDKDISISGKISDILVLLYRNKAGLYPKCRTSLKDFDDSGTDIQQILIMVDA